MPSRRVFVRDHESLASGSHSRDVRDAVTRVGVEPTDHEGLSFAALPIAYRAKQASSMGFEPTISTVTGWRALRCSTRTGIAGLCLQQALICPFWLSTLDLQISTVSIAQVGLKPTVFDYRGPRLHPRYRSAADLAGSEPRWSADCLPSHVLSILMPKAGVEPADTRPVFLSKTPSRAAHPIGVPGQLHFSSPGRT